VLFLGEGQRGETASRRRGAAQDASFHRTERSLNSPAAERSASITRMAIKVTLTASQRCYHREQTRTPLPTDSGRREKKNGYRISTWGGSARVCVPKEFFSPWKMETHLINLDCAGSFGKTVGLGGQDLSRGRIVDWPS